jgi:hypothetical protein
MICRIALRNIATGALCGCLPVPDFDPDSDADMQRDLVAETFAAYDGGHAKPFQRAADGSCGTFTYGPLVGLWEWLDFGEEPVQRDGRWATSVYRGILEDQ